ncbi:MAG TPA: hypothetical protein VIK84_06175 [Haloplasmataceae bacterium]
MKATFTMWSTLHYFMMFSPFIIALILYILFRHKSDKTKQIVAIILSVLMVIILLMRSIYMIYTRRALNPEAIPFQVCHMANFMMLFASLKKAKVIGAIAWCLNFPSALVSLIFADSLTNYQNILNIQGIAYIAGHILIVAGGLYMLLVRIIEIDKKALKQMYIIVGIMFILSVFINSWFNHIFAFTNTDANYFYSFKPEGGTPLEMFYKLGKTYEVLGITFNPIYLLLLAIFGLVIMYVFYIFAKLLSKKVYN